MAGGRGGARAGAGRKRGGINAMSKAARDAAAKTGMLPHEILMRLGRGEQVPGFSAKAPEGEAKSGKKAKAAPLVLTLEQRIDCLKASAAFYAPKLLGAVVKAAGGEQNPWAEILSLVGGKSRGLPAEASKRSGG